MKDAQGQRYEEESIRAFNNKLIPSEEVPDGAEKIFSRT